MWELDCEEGWSPKNWYFWTVMLEKRESLGLQGDPTSPFWRRSALEFLWREWCWSWNSSTLATSCKGLTHWKRLWCWRDWGQEEKRTTEDEMAGWHHWLNGRESEWIPGVGDGQGVLACCDSWGRKELDTTERLNWTELIPKHKRDKAKKKKIRIWLFSINFSINIASDYSKWIIYLYASNIKYE